DVTGATGLHGVFRDPRGPRHRGGVENAVAPRVVTCRARPACAAIRAAIRAATQDALIHALEPTSQKRPGCHTCGDLRRSNHGRTRQVNAAPA
ncbi:MAG: hypothetical protein AAF317_16530, partial [Pseudomonadota bacterium]